MWHAIQTLVLTAWAVILLLIVARSLVFGQISTSAVFSSRTIVYKRQVRPGKYRFHLIVYVAFALGLLAWLFPLPIWLGLTAMACLPAYVIFTCISQRIESKRIDRRISSGQCADCGYDVRATPDRCPECGAVRDEIA